MDKWKSISYTVENATYSPSPDWYCDERQMSSCCRLTAAAPILEKIIPVVFFFSSVQERFRVCDPIHLLCVWKNFTYSYQCINHLYSLSNEFTNYGYCIDRLMIITTYSVRCIRYASPNRISFSLLLRLAEQRNVYYIRSDIDNLLISYRRYYARRFDIQKITNYLLFQYVMCMMFKYKRIMYFTWYSASKM